MKYHNYTWLKGFGVALFLLCIAVFFAAFTPSAHAALTDIKFGRYQVADSQWNVSACLNTTTCQIYSKQPGTMYKIPWTSGQWSWQTGQYVQFSLSGNASFPYEGKVYNSNGTLAGTIGIGKIVNMGPDYFFFVGSDNNTGQLFSGSSGMSGTGGVTWTGTVNPTIAQADAYADATYSTVPLSAGQTATVTPSSGSGGGAVATNPRPTWPVINRPANQIGFGTNRSPGWYMTGHFNGQIWGSINFSYALQPDGAWARGTSYMRWPGTDNGVSRTIWFRTGYDDAHSLSINGQVVTNSGCCGYAYGSYTAKPGEIVKLEFYTNNNGGYDWVFQVAWDPQGDGSYELLDSNTVAVQDVVGGGGSYWYSSSITTEQTNILNDARTRTSGVIGNKIYIEEKVGSINNTVTIEQTGSHNMIQGLGGGNAILDGDTNTLNIKQGGGNIAGRNLIEFGIYGNSNNVTFTQARNTDTGLHDGAESGGHYAGLGINGDSNTVTIRQGNQGAANSGHFGLIYIKGDGNNLTLKQTHDGEKRAFISVDGNNNTSLISQGGLGNQYIDLMMTGNGHTANVTQTGAGSHRATINLQNAGGASVLNLTQQGTTGQQYSIMQQCANLNGCSVTLTQGGP